MIFNEIVFEQELKLRKGEKMKRFFYIIIIVLSFIYSSANAQWLQTSGANGNTITGLAENGEGLFASVFARYDSAGVILSNDFGNNWSDVNTGLPARKIDVLFANGSNLFVAENDAGVFRSIDNGASWTATGITVAYIYRFAAIGTNLFAGDANNGVYLSTDNGTSWSPVNSGLTSTQIRALFVTGSSLYAGTRGGGAFLTTDNGANWTAISGLNKYVYSFAQIGSNLFAGTGNAGVYLSTDNGGSWKAVNNGFTAYSYPIYALVVSGTNLFAGTYGGGVYLSTDNGANWTEVNEGLSFKGIQALAVSGSYLFAGADGSGVWRRPLSEMITDVNDKGSSLPSKFSLSQNYPNPFNPITNIEYTIGSRQTVILRVYDIMGNEISKIVNEEKPAGRYIVQWNASNQCSGVYFYRLQAGGYIQTRKLILLK